MEKRKYEILGVICALCLVLTVLGAFAGIGLFKVFATESEAYGDAIISRLPQYAKLGLNNPEGFFEYTITDFSFEYEEDSNNPLSGVYTQTFTFNPMEYNKSDYDYSLIIGDKLAYSTKMNGQINAYLPITFATVNDGKVTVDIVFDIVFFSDRTDMTISFDYSLAAGYLNKMAQTGLTITVIISTAMPTTPISYGGEFYEAISDGSTYNAVFNLTNCRYPYVLYEVLKNKSNSYGDGYNHQTAVSNDLTNYMNIAEEQWGGISDGDIDTNHPISLNPNSTQTIELQAGKAYVLMPKNAGTYRCNLAAGSNTEYIYDTYGTFATMGYKTGTFWIVPEKSGAANARSYELTKTVYFTLTNATVLGH